MREAKAGRAGIRQRAIDAIVHIERIAAALLHLHHHGGAAGHQCAARLGPEPGAGRQQCRPFADGGDEAGQRRRLAARIGHREAAADIDDLHRDAGGGDDLRASAEGRGSSRRLQALRADMEGQAEPRGMRPRRAQQRGRRRRRRAELAGEVVGRAAPWAGRRRTTRPSSPAPPPVSSRVWSARHRYPAPKSRTPCCAQAARIAARDFTGS